MRWLRALYLWNGLAIGAMYGFVPVLLQDKGFSPALIGITTSLGSLSYTVALPIWGHIGDVITGPRRALQIACVPAAVAGLLFGQPLPVIAVIICLVIMSLGGGPSMALTDAMAMPALTHTARESGRFGSIGEAFRIQPRLALVLASIVFLFIGIMAAATFISLRISDLGGGAPEVGMANGIGSSAEIPGLILAGFLVARFGARPVLVISSIGFAACLFSWIFLVDVWPILITRFISGIFFSGALVSYVLTISRMLPSGLQSTGQTLLQACCYGGGAILANFLGGILYGTMGPIGVFGGGAICALIGGAIGYFGMPEFGNPATEEDLSPMPSVVATPVT